jgi:hypothetical protein
VKKKRKNIADFFPVHVDTAMTSEEIGKNLVGLSENNKIKGITQFQDI